MSISLTPVRFITANDPRHYSIDNRPLQDLDANIQTVKTAVETLQANVVGYTSSGNWAGLQIPLSLIADRGKPFSYFLKIWAVKDSTYTSFTDSTLIQINVLGYSTGAGIVTIQNSAIIGNTSTGSAVTVILTGAADAINITFSGYTGASGYVSVKAERFGL